MSEQRKAEAFVAYLLAGDPDVEAVKERMRHLKRRREETGRTVLEIIADEDVPKQEAPDAGPS